jgi:hypothetical protein
LGQAGLALSVKLKFAAFSDNIAIVGPDDDIVGPHYEGSYYFCDEFPGKNYVRSG